MNKVLDFDPQFSVLLPATYNLLKSSNLAVHESVSRIILHGSRGFAGGARPNSDIDLSLIVDAKVLANRADKEAFLHDVSETTLTNWKSHTELDLAVIFDIRSCNLKCFYPTSWDENLCSQCGIDCFGIYKTQKGFSGIVTNAAVQVKLMYPCLTIWERD